MFPSRSERSLRVVMLANNPCVSDARVIREAEALANNGHDVVVLARTGEGAAVEEVRNNVRYRRISSHKVPRKKAGENAAPRRSLPLERSDNVRIANITESIPTDAAPPLPQALGSLLARGKARTGAALKRLMIGTVTGSGVAYFRHVRDFVGPGCALRPDVVHAHDLATLPAGLAVARRTKARLVYDSHELEMGRNAVYSTWERSLRSVSERYLIRRCDGVITVCDSIAGVLGETYGIPRPVVIFNAPANTDVSTSGRDVRSHIGLAPQTPLAIFVGKLTHNRGIEQCVRALTHDEELHFACVGPRVEKLADAIIADAIRFGVQDRFHLVDPVPPDDVTSFVSTADVSLITIQDVCLSYHYCFPNKLLESIFAGLPIVVSRLPELEGMVRLTGAGVVTDQTDPAAIAASVRDIVDKRSQYVLPPARIEALKGQFGWKAQTAKLLRLYAEIASQPGNRVR